MNEISFEGKLDNKSNKDLILKQQRNRLLEKGTHTSDKRFYFTERTAEKFVMDYASLEDDEKLVWKDTSGNIVELTKEEVKPYVKEIKEVLRKVYGLL
jgi:acid phosphatase class B